MNYKLIMSFATTPASVVADMQSSNPVKKRVYKKKTATMDPSLIIPEPGKDYKIQGKDQESEPEPPKDGFTYTKDTIEQIIKGELEKRIEATESCEDRDVLSHLGNYLEEPYKVIESYFRDQHLERLVRHQIESYNHFINFQVQRTIQMFNPVVIHSENDFVVEHGQYFLEVEICFENFKLYPPQIHENNGATKMMLPHEAKLRNFTYASTMTVDVHVKYIVRNTEKMNVPGIVEDTLL